jgi:hypothetical protein
MVACVSWRAMGGRTAGVRALGFLPSQVLLPCRHCAWCVDERALGNIEWLCIQERWNPEVAIILGTAACYRRATVGSSHDDVHPDNPALHTGAVRPHPGFVESLLFISSRNGLARKCSKCCQLFRAFRGRAFLRGMVQPYFSVGPTRQWKGTSCFCLGGLALLEFHGASSPW